MAISTTRVGVSLSPSTTNMTCARRCPTEAIISAKNQIHIIEQDKCIKCGTCFEACPPEIRLRDEDRGRTGSASPFPKEKGP